MCGTIRAAVGRYWSVRSTEATSLHVRLLAHVLVPCPAGHVLAVWATSHVLHVLACRTTSFVLAIQIVFERVGCFMRYMLLVVPLRLQAVHEDLCYKVVLDHPSDGSIMVSSSYKNV